MHTFVIFLALGAAGWCVGYFFFRGLRTRHPDSWTDLGSPTLLYDKPFVSFPFGDGPEDSVNIMLDIEFSYGCVK